MLAESLFDLALGDVQRRADDVARHLVAELDDVFAEIGLDRLDAVLLEEIVDADLLADHGLALGDRLGAGLAAEAQDGLARGLGVAAPMDLAARRLHLRLELQQVLIEMTEDVVLQ